MFMSIVLFYLLLIVSFWMVWSRMRRIGVKMLMFLYVGR